MGAIPECVLIGPCGIETHSGRHPYRVVEVLIGPCGIETSRHTTLFARQSVLIGPCGIETQMGYFNY